MNRQMLVVVLGWLISQGAQAVPLPSYSETGDAGGFLSSQNILGSGVGSIRG